MLALPTPQANALHADISLVEKRIQAGVTAQRAKAMDNHWGR
jgi:hypothetical protein